MIIDNPPYLLINPQASCIKASYESYIKYIPMCWWLNHLKPPDFLLGNSIQIPAGFQHVPTCSKSHVRLEQIVQPLVKAHQIRSRGFWTSPCSAARAVPWRFPCSDTARWAENYNCLYDCLGVTNYNSFVIMRCYQNLKYLNLTWDIWGSHKHIYGPLILKSTSQNWRGKAKGTQFLSWLGNS